MPLDFGTYQDPGSSPFLQFYFLLIFSLYSLVLLIGNSANPCPHSILLSSPLLLPQQKGFKTYRSTSVHLRDWLFVPTCKYKVFSKFSSKNRLGEDIRHHCIFLGLRHTSAQAEGVCPRSQWKLTDPSAKVLPKVGGARSEPFYLHHYQTDIKNTRSIAQELQT